MSAHQLITVAGLSGSGKTTLGRCLAHSTGLGFIDLDDWIEKRCQSSIAQIFAAEKEEGFRARESAALSEVLKAHNHIIALGGGTLILEENRRSITDSKALSIWLDFSCSALASQIICLPDLRSFFQQRPLFWPLLQEFFAPHSTEELWAEQPTHSIWEKLKGDTKTAFTTKLTSHLEKLAEKRKEGSSFCQIQAHLDYASPSCALYILKNLIKEAR